MFSRISEAICCILIFCAVCATAEEPAVVDIQPREDVLWVDEVAQLASTEAPESVWMLQLWKIPDNKPQFDDKAIERLERFHQLRTLLVSCPKMTDKSLKCFAKLKHLECLIIYQCEITDSGLEDLKVLSKLQTVGFFETSITEEGVAKLKTTLGKTYFELGSFGKTGKVFDANGCIRSSVAKQHLKVRKPLPK